MRFDLVVVGGGSGGVRAARVAAGLGARVALVEARQLGGTCVNLGCIPKKLLAYGARFGEHLEDARGFGWQVEGIAFDWAALVAAKDREVRRLNGAYQGLLERAGVAIVPGRAVLRDARTVEVGERRLEAERILLATGGTPWRTEIPGHDLAWVSDDVFHLPRLPRSVVVIGGGYVALELASILGGLGSTVTVLARGELLRGFDREAVGFLADRLAQRGVRVLSGVSGVAIEEAGDGQVLVGSDGHRYAAERVLLACGRRAVTDGLGLEALGVRASERGIVVDASFETTVPGIFAVGDCADRGRNASLALTPVALAEGTVVAHHLFGEPGRAMDYRDVPTAVFTSPSLATVGLSEEEARRRLPGGRVFTTAFRPLVHRLSGRDEATFVKLVVDGVTDRVVGAQFVGDDAGEVIQGVAIALRAGATKATFDATLGIHPTVAEEFVTLRSPTRSWG